MRKDKREVPAAGRHRLLLQVEPVGDTPEESILVNSWGREKQTSF